MWLAPALALLLLATGCGNGDDSGGGGGGGVRVTVNPAAITITLNGTQQFTAAVSGVTGVPIATSNGAVRSSGVVTITTSQAHNVMAGQTVSITGVTDASFIGTFTVVSAPSSTTFTYQQAGPDAMSGGGTVVNNSVTWSVNDMAGGDATVGTITSAGLYTAPASLPPPQSATITPTGAVRSSNSVTITTSANHNIQVGQIVLISGVTDTSFNGTFVVATIPSTTTFTYAQLANNAMSGGGMVTSFSVRIKATSVVDANASSMAVVNLNSGVTVQVSPANATVGTDETFQFFSTVLGTSNPAVTWEVNEIPAGNTTVGTISPNGLYTAPSTPPASSTVAINSNGAVRASNVVTITTASAHGFRANQSVVIAGVSDTSFNGTFTIASVPSASTFTYAQTGPDATSGGGTATSASSSVTIRATSAADPTRSATALATIQIANDPTLASISPTKAAQGAVFQDVYLAGANFLSTSSVRVNGTPLSPAAITQFSSSLIRARLDASLLAAPGSLTIDVQRQNGVTTPPQTLNVVSVRPAVIGASPDSGLQGGGAFSFNVNGGYYGASVSPVVTGEFAGSTRLTSVNAANEGRQASVTIGSADLATAGLFPVTLRNISDTTLFSAANLAVQPSAAPGVLGAPIPVGSQPGAIAINTATGVAVVTNRCSNTITRIDVATLAPIGADIAVGAYPTGVAVDEVRNLAIVVNNGNNAGCMGAPGMPSLSIVDLATGAVTATIMSLSGAPLSAGVNPLTGLALITYQSTNHADILDLNLMPPAIVSTASISTGANPQVAVEPRLNWAVVTPGGAGTLSIVDLARRTTAAIAATSGASRTNGVTTITTVSAHTFFTGQAVLISGVADPSFNGVFTITSVPSSTSFTLVHNAPNATSGGGMVVTTPPLATATVGAAVRGIAINTFTRRALLTDPGAPNPFLLNLFDQAVTSIPVNEVGATAAAFNSFTDIAVTVNPNTNQASVLDPRTPTRLATVPVGAGARAVAIDPGTNTAFVVNETDGTVTAIGLGAIRSLHIASISMPLNRQFAPGITLSSAVDLPLTIVGKGLVSGSVVRLDGVALPLPTSVTDRQLTVTVPAAMLGGARRYVVDVLNPGNVVSNVLDLTVVQPVDLVGAGGASCTAPAPVAVAIDAERDVALVTNSGCDSVSVVDLTTGAITATLAVQDNPRGVGVSSRLGRAFVTNSGSASVSVLNLTASPPTVLTTTTVGTEPLGVAVDENTGRAVVANATSNSISILDAATGGSLSTINVDARPVAVAVDPDRQVVAVANAAQNNVNLVSLSTLTLSSRIAGPSLPSAVVFDPVTRLFAVNSSLGNGVLLINPDTTQVASFRTGINPTSMGYNFQSATLLTVNTASGTVSVIDFLDRRVRDVLSLPGSSQFSVEIHPRTNLAVLADQAGHRLLLVPLR
jgi:YVTN family beta-propeller protein